MCQNCRSGALIKWTVEAKRIFVLTLLSTTSAIRKKGNLRQNITS